MTRDELKEEHFNGYMFGGNGYVILDKDRFKVALNSPVFLQFRTFADDGLLFLMGNYSGVDFYSLELRGGKIVFQFNLGSGLMSLETDERYNDGQWHSIDANRDNKNGMLKVDSIPGE